jgi:hypothetical protein
MGKASEKVRPKGMTMAEIVITIEREPGAKTVAAYSDEPSITVVRDAAVSNKELLAAYAEALEERMRVSA